MLTQGAPLPTRSSLPGRRGTIGPYYAFPVHPLLIPVVMAADEAYAAAAAVALHSLLRQCSRADSLSIALVDCGLSAQSRARLESVAARGGAMGGGVQWLGEGEGEPHVLKSTVIGSCSLPREGASESSSAQPVTGSSHGPASADAGADTTAEVGGATSTSGHAIVKLVMAGLVFLRTDKFLYLDADVLVRGDVAELWDGDAQQGMRGAIGAVRDVGFPVGHGGLHEHGWDPLSHRYFNAGVMIVHTASLAAEEAALLHNFKQGSWRYGDQDVLNLRFRDRWYALDPAWNAQGLGTYAHLHTKQDPKDPSTGAPPLFTPATLQQLTSNPRIVHFEGKSTVDIRSLGNPHVPAPLKPWLGPAEAMVCASSAGLM
ncbi:nucleotide-diphospho-sugar transferase [Tribonema minus]|uniref:Nucleotide-diphospho-sugar transferase n=1 Tax=Tribonema minus TaxID=303371 RepID=A0A835YRI3_9STRA|nr:nucleotide-diphospho-sugar transferase [Tribonema minus]